jgi:SSS family solute:Na+ symporter
VGICWVLVIKALHSNLYTYLQSVQGYLSPAIVVLFVFGVFWKRANATGALVAFIVGAIGGFARLAADIYMRNDDVFVNGLKDKLFHHAITLDQYNAAIAPIRAKFGLIFDFWNINWLFFCEGLLVVSAVLVVAVSYLTKAPDPKTVKFTWYGASPEEKAATRASWNTMDVILSAGVVLIVIAFYYFFW